MDQRIRSKIAFRSGGQKPKSIVQACGVSTCSSNEGCPLLGALPTFHFAPHLSAFGGKADHDFLLMSVFLVAFRGKADIAYCSAYRGL
jgi:hypothetical protein